MVDYDIERLWRGIKRRCQSSRKDAYRDCEICDEWKTNFDLFAEWCLDNLYICGDEKLEIDKDLFSQGKKVYSPETCCFLPKRLNTALAFRKEKSDGLPPGVHNAENGKYTAIIHRGHGHLFKTFSTVEEASDFYKSNKERHIRELALAYKRYLPEKIFDALWNYKCQW